MPVLYNYYIDARSGNPRGCGNSPSTVNDYHSHLGVTPPHPVGLPVTPGFRSLYSTELFLQLLKIVVDIPSLTCIMVVSSGKKEKPFPILPRYFIPRRGRGANGKNQPRGQMIINLILTSQMIIILIWSYLRTILILTQQMRINLILTSLTRKPSINPSIKTVLPIVHSF